MASFKALKQLTFTREGGEKVIKKGATFTPDSSMDVDRMVKSGKIAEVKKRG